MEGLTGPPLGQDEQAMASVQLLRWPSTGKRARPLRCDRGRDAGAKLHASMCYSMSYSHVCWLAVGREHGVLEVAEIQGQIQGHISGSGPAGRTPAHG